MDTLKVTVKKDTVVKTDNKTSQHTTVETVNYKKCNDCWKNWCDCKFLADIIWPITILIILTVFYKRLKFILDSIGERIKKGDNVELGKSGIKIQRPTALKDEEVKAKAEEEYKQTIEEQTTNVTEQKATITAQTTEKEKFVQSYLNVEKIISEKLRQFFSDKFRVMTNYRIQHFEYDVILNAPLIQDEDKIIEIKYYPRGTTSVYIRETLMRLHIAQNVYQDTMKKIGKPILLIVLPKDKFNLFDIAKLKETPKQLKHIKLDNLSLHFLEEEKLNDLTKEWLTTIIEEG
jgi:hypothetical protein